MARRNRPCLGLTLGTTCRHSPARHLQASTILARKKPSALLAIPHSPALTSFPPSPHTPAATRSHSLGSLCSQSRVSRRESRDSSSFPASPPGSLSFPMVATLERLLPHLLLAHVRSPTSSAEVARALSASSARPWGGGAPAARAPPSSAQCSYAGRML